MTDAEISRWLALAIGWEVLPVEHRDEGVMVVDHVNQVGRYFDYRDPAVIWPIAERYNCFPQATLFDSSWYAITQDGWDMGLDQSLADTAAKAVALAVIKAHEGSKTT